MRQPVLTARQQRFVAEYLKDLNATQAAIRSGYAAKTAESSGPRLLRNVRVRDAIVAGKERQLEKAEASAVRTLEGISCAAFGDLRGLFDEDGNLKPIHRLTREQAVMIASFEVVKKNAEAGDGKTDIVHKVKVLDRLAALALLAKHFGLLKERIQVEGGIQISWQE